MVFGKWAVCARLGAPDLLWVACRLPAADTVKYLRLRLESEGGWAAQQAAGAANGWVALHQWLPVLCSQYLSAATKLLVLRSRIAPCMTYGIELWRPAKNGAKKTAVLPRAGKLISGIHGEASHTAFFKDRSVNPDVMLADLDILSAADHCRMAHARHYARQAASAAAAATYVHNDPCSPEFRIELSAACAPDYMGAAVWQGLRTRDTWCECARTCHETALSHGVRSTSTPTRAAPDMAGEVANTTRKDIRIGISASALVCRSLRQPSHGQHGRPRAPACDTHFRWAADIRNPSSREHLWSAAVRSAYTTASSAFAHPIMSLHSSHLHGDHCLDFGVTAVAAACSLCHDNVFPSCPDFGSAPRAQAAREHRWRHTEHLLFECQCFPGLDSSVALALLRDDLFRACSGSDRAEAVLLAPFPTSRIPIVAATACVVPFLLDPAAALDRMSPWHMKLQCLDNVAAFLLGVSPAVCTRQPPTASMLAHFHLPAWSSVHACLLRLRTASDFAPARLPAPDPVLHVSAPVRRGADARLGLA